MVTITLEAERCLSCVGQAGTPGRGLALGHATRPGPSTGSPCWRPRLVKKKSRVLKNWCLQTMVLEETPESPLDNKETKPVNLKGNQP